MIRADVEELDTRIECELDGEGWICVDPDTGVYEDGRTETEARKRLISRIQRQEQHLARSSETVSKDQGAPSLTNNDASPRINANRIIYDFTVNRLQTLRQYPLTNYWVRNRRAERSMRKSVFSMPGFRDAITYCDSDEDALHFIETTLRVMHLSNSPTWVLWNATSIQRAHQETTANLSKALETMRSVISPEDPQWEDTIIIEGIRDRYSGYIRNFDSLVKSPLATVGRISTLGGAANNRAAATRSAMSKALFECLPPRLKRYPLRTRPFALIASLMGVVGIQTTPNQVRKDVAK